MCCLQSSYYSKLEKADILEMTVKYLNSLKRQRAAGMIQLSGYHATTWTNAGKHIPRAHGGFDLYECYLVSYYAA